MVARGGAERNPWYDSLENPIKPRRGDRFCRPYGAPSHWFGSVPGVALRSTPGYHRSPLRGYGCLMPLAICAIGHYRGSALRVFYWPAPVRSVILWR